MPFHPFELVTLLFATIGPLKVTIVAASLTAGTSAGDLERLARRAVLVAGAVCLTFVLLGEVILGLFRVTVPAFQIGGSIIVLLFALEMVVGGKQAVKDRAPGAVAEGGDPEPLSADLAVYPLAIPLMASVSGLVAIVSALAQRNDLARVAFLAAAIAAIMAVNYACLRACRRIVDLLGPVTLQVVSKLMGVILTALAVELFLMGVGALGLLPRAAAPASAAPAPAEETGWSGGAGRADAVRRCAVAEPRGRGSPVAVGPRCPRMWAWSPTRHDRRRHAPAGPAPGLAPACGRC
jgi:multiple antibiotic resistance protein